MAYRPSNIPSFSGLASDPATQAKMAAGNGNYMDYVQSQKDAAKKQFLKTAAIGSAGLALGPALGGLAAPGIGIGGAQITSAPLMSLPAAASQGSRFSLGSLLKLGELGANLFGSITGQHSQNKAQDMARLEQQREFDLQQQMLQKQMVDEKAEKDRVFLESQRQWDADQKFKADQFRASEEERLRRLRLDDEAEARKAPRRAASQQALLRLQDLIRLGR